MIQIKENGGGSAPALFLSFVHKFQPFVQEGLINIYEGGILGIGILQCHIWKNGETWRRAFPRTQNMKGVR